MAVVPANHCFGMMVDFYGAVMKECQGHWEEIVDTLGAGQVVSSKGPTVACLRHG